MAKNSAAFSHPYPAMARLFQQARLARLANSSSVSEDGQLALTEGELLTAGIGKYVVPLRSDWHELLCDLFSLGNVRLVTAGASAFIEKHGVYPLPEFSGTQATLFDTDTEVAMSLEEWGRAFAVFPTTSGKHNVTECGLHFFNSRGTAMHRVFLSTSGSTEAFGRISDEYRHFDKAAAPRLASELSPHSEVPARADPPEQVSALKYTEAKIFRRVQNYEVLRTFHNSRQVALPIRISIGTAGCIQTHTGILRDFHTGTLWTCANAGNTILYFRDADITETRIVETMTEEGLSVSSVITQNRP